MKAILMPQPGGADVLQYADVALPELPSPHHLRVRLAAAGVNPVDTKLRKAGTYFPERGPAILGCDGAGVVESVGPAVTRFKPGDEVFFMNGGIGADAGNYAEFTVVHEDHAAAKPAGLDMIHAAALPLALITAWEALFDRAGLHAGQSVLIHAAAGGVGHIAVQLARHAGARITATVSNAEKAALAQRFGAEKVIDYTREDFVEAALEWTDGKGVEVVFDTVGGAAFCRSFAAAKVYGKVVTLLQSECPAADLKLARTRNQSIHYELMLTPMFLGIPEARINQRRMLENAALLAEQGRLEVLVSHTLPLSDAAQAHRLIESGHTAGKIVLIP